VEISSYPAQDASKAKADLVAAGAGELKQIGAEVAKAVLSKNIPALLNFERENLRYADEFEFQNQQSTLFCYVFDSKCTSPKRRSVYEILSQVSRLGIEPILSRSLQRDREGVLVFYDASKVSTALLLSKGYLCKQHGRTLVTWSFKMTNGRWEPETPPFDSETEGPC
jgi:hypothetical protein